MKTRVDIYRREQKRARDMLKCISLREAVMFQEHADRTYEDSLFEKTDRKLRALYQMAVQYEKARAEEQRQYFRPQTSAIQCFRAGDYRNPVTRRSIFARISQVGTVLAFLLFVDLSMLSLSILQAESEGVSGYWAPFWRTQAEWLLGLK